MPTLSNAVCAIAFDDVVEMVAKTIGEECAQLARKAVFNRPSTDHLATFSSSQIVSIVKEHAPTLFRMLRSASCTTRHDETNFLTNMSKRAAGHIAATACLVPLIFPQ